MARNPSRPSKSPEPRPTRRDFVRATALAGASLALGAGCSEGDEPVPLVDAGPVYPPFDEIPMGQVTLVRAATAAEAVARGVVLMNGMSFIQPGQKVLLKPNLTASLLFPPDVTSPPVLVELVRQCYLAGAGEVIVAERSYYNANTAFVFSHEYFENNTKSWKMYLEEVGATIRPLDDEPWVEVSPAGALDFEEPILIPAILDEVDQFINVPALKTHYQAAFTMAMKNLFGFVHPDVRMSQVHGHPKNDADPDREKRMFAQMNLAFSPILNVMDAIVSRTTGGPTPPGDEAATDMVLFGRDRVAMDAVGLAILQVVGTEPAIEDKPIWEQVQLAEAVKCGFGVSGPDDITLVADGVDEIDSIETKLRTV